MASFLITSADICKVTGYTRNQVRGLLQKLPGYAEQEAAPGVAREYTRSDLLILAVVHHMEAKFKIHRDALAAIVGLVRNELSGPKTINQDARLVLLVEPPSAIYLANAHMQVNEGVVIALGPIFERVDSHLKKKFENPYTSASPELNFGPTLAAPSRKKVGG